MSNSPKRIRKTGKFIHSSRTSEEDDVTQVSKSIPVLQGPVQLSTPEGVEPPDSRRSSGSSDLSDNDTPRSMVHGIIEVISARVQTQLNTFLTTEIAGLLTDLRTDLTKKIQLSLEGLIEDQERLQKQVTELRERVAQQAEVQKEQKQWMTIEASLVDQLQQQQSDYLVLNVGGVEYATSRGTLLKYPHSMLGAMFSGRYKQITDPQGRHFIDRDGPLFRHILNFLRTDTLSSVDLSHTHLLSELLQEANYYQIESLVSLLSTLVTKSEDHAHGLTSTLVHYRTRVKDDPAHSLSSSSSGSKTHNSHKHKSKRYSSDCEIPAYTREQIHLFKLQHTTPGLRNRLNLAGLDLSGIDLSKLDLSYVNFSRCNLTGASFEMANLVGCNFSQSTLRQVNFQQASFGTMDIECPDFTDAILQGANFTRYVGVLFRNRFEGVEDDMIGLELRWLR